MLGDKQHGAGLCEPGEGCGLDAAFWRDKDDAAWLAGERQPVGVLLSCSLIGEKDEESDPEPVVEGLGLHVMKVSLCSDESPDMTAMTSADEEKYGRRARGRVKLARPAELR